MVNVREELEEVLEEINTMLENEKLEIRSRFPSADSPYAIINGSTQQPLLMPLVLAKAEVLRTLAGFVPELTIFEKNVSRVVAEERPVHYSPTMSNPGAVCGNDEDDIDLAFGPGNVTCLQCQRKIRDLSELERL